MRLCLAVCCYLALAGHVYAQNYPEKAVTLVVAFTPGGSTDAVARTLGQRLNEIWSHPVVIVNRPGADGRIGTESVVKANADGYTILVGTTALAIWGASTRNTSYDPRKDLAPISKVIVTPNVLAVHPSLPAKTVRELIALAKKRPGQLTSSSGGTATSNHLALVLFNVMAGVNILHIPYKGAAPAATDTVGGHVDMTFAPILAAVQLVRAGKLRGLAVTTAVRSSALPAVPTISEAGLAGYEASSWVGLLAPAATPRTIIGRIHSATMDILRVPRVKEVLGNMGAELVGNTPDQFAQELRDETAKWIKVMKASKEKLE